MKAAKYEQWQKKQLKKLKTDFKKRFVHWIVKIFICEQEFLSLIQIGISSLQNIDKFKNLKCK